MQRNNVNDFNDGDLNSTFDDENIEHENGDNQNQNENNNLETPIVRPEGMPEGVGGGH